MAHYYLDENRWNIIADPIRIDPKYTQIPASFLTRRCREALKDTWLHGIPATLPANDHNLSRQGKANLKAEKG